MPAPPAYHLKDIRHGYGDKTVLTIDDLTIETGSITGIMGPNGSGKSTLLKLLAFVQRPTSGQVLFNGQPEYPFSPTVRSRVTLLTQRPYLLKRNVFDNMAYGLNIRKDKERQGERIREALISVGLEPEVFLSRKWHELSGGEAQRVALAARLLLRPDVLLLDEPIASVDTESAELIRDASLAARKDMGMTLVIVSHDLQWLYSVSDTQLSIHNGKIFSTGMENIITGPFLEFKNDNDKDHDIDTGASAEANVTGKVARPLSDGQQIILKAPAAKTTDETNQKITALIKKQDLTLDAQKQAEHPDLNQISGVITQMMLEKQSGFTLSTLTAGDVSFVVRLTPDQVSQTGLMPGKSMIVKFSSDCVEWI